MNQNQELKENKHWLENEETAQQRIEQARTLKNHASKGGLKFEAYLTPDLAVWVLDIKWTPPSRHYCIEFKRLAVHTQRNGAAPLLFLSRQ